MALILGVTVSEFTKTEALKKVGTFLDSNKPHYIFTPNPEMVVEASRDINFKNAINQGDLNVCDGFGLALFARTPRIAGVDFMLDLCALAEQEKKSIYLLGSGDREVLHKTTQFLQQKFPELLIAGSHPGYEITVNANGLQYNTNERDEVLHDIIMHAPTMVFVAFGHNKQEQWIVQNVPNLPSVRIAMGVGGAFDFLGGKAKRAPGFLQAIGLEWMWRLALEPHRIRRIIKATIIFPFLFFTKQK